MNYKFIWTFFLLCSLSIGYAQSKKKLWKPSDHEFEVVEGQAWPLQTPSPFNRLPNKIASEIAPQIWALAKNSAGLMIRFRSNAEEIKIRYRLNDKIPLQMGHLPATLMSGLDMYAIDSDGEEHYCAPERTFGEVVIYSYSNLNPDDIYHDIGNEYRLYLPNYNEVVSMEIEVDEKAYFEPLPVRKEKPIVAYGTSIVQGACASRPGMAWTSILSRKMDRPLINLGFSGYGNLDLSIIELMSEIDAKIYIIDCMPNLTSNLWKTHNVDGYGSLKDRILKAVSTLWKNQPHIPILMVDHAGYTESLTSEKKKREFIDVNEIQHQAFQELKRRGLNKIFYLKSEEIGLGKDDNVDGLHPTDLGMMKYAMAYEKKLRSILNEPIGVAKTTNPITQYREPENYDWENRHREILDLNQSKNPPKIVFISNSIIHFWGGFPKAKISIEPQSWSQSFNPLGMGNYAFGWDRIENVLWRIYHGELDGFKAKEILVMIGTNNIHINNDEEILEGLSLLMKGIKSRQPSAEITFMGLLPRRDYEPRIKILNFKIAKLASENSLYYGDLGYVLLNSEGKIDESLFSDGLHPNSKGYHRLREVLIPLINK
jgi:lysophospholipase L1-like esterase